MNEVVVIAPGSPYKGLAAFDDSPADALFFFGREREAEVIAANVMASRFTVLYGPLGVGKSSVLRAGVVRRLRSRAPDALVVVHDSWAGDAVGDLVNAVASMLRVDAPPPDVPLADALAQLVGRSGGELLLILDQFEEVFVYPGAGAVAASLAEVVMRADVRVDVLLALREDALAELDVFTGRIPDVFGNHLPLDRLDRAAARVAITGPVARFNELTDGPPVEIEHELVEAVLEQVEVGRVAAGGRDGQARAGGDGSIEAPYLQLVMERLWRAEQGRGSTVLRRATLDELGGAQAIVRAHLGAAVGALSPAERDVAARVFNHLVTPSGTKIAHGAGDLAQYAAVDEAELLPVLESLGRDRIVRPVDGRFEIFHDVLADAVSAWRTRHEAERALQLQRAEAERRHRRLLLLLASTVTALAVVAVIAIYALTQRSEAREQAGRARAEATTARANALATQASLLVPITAVAADPQLGLLLAAEAARLSPGGRTADLLRRALLVSHLRAVLPERGVTSASFSPDGTRIAVGSRRGTASVYTGDARRRLRTLRLGHAARTVAFAPGGRRLLTTERDGPARIWDARRGVQLHALGLSPTEASFSADGRLVMTVDAGRARIWNAADGSKVAVLRQPDAVRHASFAPRGARVVTVGTGSVARIFDARSGARVAAVDQGGPITSATLTPRGGLLTTGGNLPPRIWTLRRGGRLVRELPGARNVTAGVVAPDGDLLVTVSTDGVPRAWELGSGRLVADLVGHTNRVAGAGFSRDSRSVVTWSSDGTALVWDPARGSARVALAGHGDAVTDAAFDRSGDAVLTTSADGRARLWSSRVGADLEDVVREIPKPISAATFSDDGRTVAAAGPSATRVLRARDGQDLARVPARRVGALALSRDGSLLATAEPKRVAVWRAATGERVSPRSATTTTTTTAGATALAFSPDARRLAIGKRDGSILVSTPGTVRTARLTRGPSAVSSLAFAPSGATLAAGFADGTVAAWNVRDRRRILRVRAHRPGTAVRAIAFGPGGQQLVTTGDDSAVRIWDVAAGRPAYTLHGHYGTVRDAAFSPDGRWLVTAGPSAAGLWDLSTRERLLFVRSREGQGRVLAVAFDASGRRGATVSADGTLRAFRCDVCADIPELRRLAARATAATGRRLSARERRRYLGG